MATIIRADQALTAPLDGTPVVRLPGDRVVMTSDGFGGAAAGNISGRLTDAALGGSSYPWASTFGTATGIGNGRLVPGSDNGGIGYFSYLTSAGEADVLVEFTVAAIPTTNSPLNMDLFRDADSSSESNKLRFTLNNLAPNVSLYMGAPAATTGNTMVPASTFAIAAGDRLGVRYNSQTRSARTYRNGTQVGEFFGLPLYTGRKFGVAGLSYTSNTWALDDLVLTQTIV